MDMNALDQRIESYRAEALSDLAAWVKIPSVAGPAQPGKPFGEAVDHMLERALSDARRMGFEARAFDGYCGHVVMGAGEETMGILAHLDVVPVGEGWTKPPFGGVVEGGRLYGRGTSDDKGPALAALYAMRAVREAGIPLRHQVRLILGCDEETGMSDMRHYAQCADLPSYGFSPDGMYPVINIEKGGLNLLISQRTQGEAGAELPVLSMRAGTRVNVVPGVAQAELGLEHMDFEALAGRLEEVRRQRPQLALHLEPAGTGRALLTATGVSAHASMPEKGVNAIGMLMIALEALGAGGGCRGAIEVLAGKFGMEGDGRSCGAAISDEESGPLTLNLGLLEYDGCELSVQVDIRYPVTASEPAICGAIVCALSGSGLGLTRLGGHEPLYMPKDHPVVKGLLEVYHEVTGLPAYPIAIGGGTYSRMMPNTVAFGCLFPGDEETCHMPDEYIEIDKFMTSVRIMARAIVRLAGQQ